MQARTASNTFTGLEEKKFISLTFDWRNQRLKNSENLKYSSLVLYFISTRVKYTKVSI